MEIEHGERPSGASAFEDDDERNDSLKVDAAGGASRADYRGLFSQYLMTKLGAVQPTRRVRDVVGPSRRPRVWDVA